MGRQVRNREDIATLMRHVVIDAVSGCWEWVGYIQSAGYGQISIEGRRWLAHRLSWALHHRSDDTLPLEPPALNVLHRCDNPPCCNPDHLFDGTQGDNIADAIAKGRIDPMNLSRHSRKKRLRTLTDEQVREIRTGGGGNRELSEKFGVAQSTISRVRLGRRKQLVLAVEREASSYHAGR